MVGRTGDASPVSPAVATPLSLLDNMLKIFQARLAFSLHAINIIEFVTCVLSVILGLSSQETEYAVDSLFLLFVHRLTSTSK